MKELRGAVLALGVLLVLGGLWIVSEEAVPEEDVPQLFSFEKHDVQRAVITRPDGLKMTLEERDGVWIIAETGHLASMTMVNRIRHQLHDLQARAEVSFSDENAERYGLAEQAIRVDLYLKGGETLSFLAGDPNPTGVSYYIRPLSGNSIYTVKKSALDYYSSPYDSFRASRFLTFETSTVDQFSVQKEGEEWLFTRLDVHRWELQKPVQMRASAEAVRRLIGRCLALKTTEFLDPEEQTGDEGLDNPLLSISFQLNSGATKELRIGSMRGEGVSHFQVVGDPVVYIAKNGLLEEFDFQVDKIRNKKMVDVDASEIQSIQVTSNDDQHLKEVSVSFVAGEWFWSDGVPVPGSTPRRLSSALSQLEAQEFVDSALLGEILSEIRVGSTVGERVVQIGASAPPKLVSDGTEYPRRYAKVSGADEVFTVDEHLVQVSQDLLREAKRHVEP